MLVQMSHRACDNCHVTLVYAAVIHKTEPLQRYTQSNLFYQSQIIMLDI